MTTRTDEVAVLYRVHRLEDQWEYYTGTAARYDRAAGQATALTAVFMAVAAVAAFLSATDLLGEWGGWSVVAAIAPALATALATFEGLYGFERNAKLYEDAARALATLSEPPGGEGALHEHVQEAEGILRREQSQWGQLALEAEPPR